MAKLFLEYYLDFFEEQEIADIKSICEENSVETEIVLQNRGIMNAALDELVADFLVVINSNELQTILSVSNVITAIVQLVHFVYKKLKNKSIKSVYPGGVIEEKEKYVNIEVGDVKILMPKDVSEEDLEKFIRVSLKCTNEINKTNQEDTPMKQVICEYSIETETMEACYLEEFAKKKQKMSYRKIVSVPIDYETDKNT